MATEKELLKMAETGDPKALEQLYLMYRESQLEDEAAAFRCFDKMAEAGIPEAQYALAGMYRYDGSLFGYTWEDAFPWYQKAAEGGYVKAMVGLGELCEYFKEDMEEAFQWYLKAAESGSVEVLMDLGKLCKDFKGDTEEALRWFLKAGQQGNTWARSYLVDCLRELGEAGEEWYGDILDVFREQAEQEDTEAYYDLGSLYDEMGRKESSFRSYLKAAEMGYAAAQWIVGFRYEKMGQTAKGIEWMEKAAAQGDDSAMTELGHMYKYCSDESIRDEEKSFYWYLQGAEHGSRWSQRCAAFECEKRGRFEEALRWASAVVEADGDKDIQCLIGKMYLLGEGIEVDEEKGAAWIREAFPGKDGTVMLQTLFYTNLRMARQGNPDAMLMVEEVYRTGAGEIPKDYEACVFWLHKAAEQEKTAGEALFRLGYLYDKGEVVPWDLKAKREYYEKAIEHGHPAAMYNMGIMYYYGNSGVVQDKKKAKKLLLAAAKLGHEGAKTAGKDLFLLFGRFD